MGNRMKAIEWWKVSIEKGWDKKQKLPIQYMDKKAMGELFLNAKIQPHDVQITPRLIFNIVCPLCGNNQVIELPATPSPITHTCTNCQGVFNTQLF